MRVDTLIKMSRTEIRFTNLGGLEGISVEDAIDGLTEARNPLLRPAFLPTEYRRGTRHGSSAYFPTIQSGGANPTVHSDNNRFYLSLPNVNTTRNPYLSLKRNDGPNLRGEYDDYKKLDDGGMLPPEVARAFAPYA